MKAKKPAPFRARLRLLEQHGYLRDQSGQITASDCRIPAGVHSGKDREGLPETGKSRSKLPAALKVPPEGSARARIRPLTINSALVPT